MYTIIDSLRSFLLFILHLEIYTKPRNSKIVKMEQNDVEINLDSTGTKTQLIYIFELLEALIKCSRRM